MRTSLHSFPGSVDGLIDWCPTFSQGRKTQVVLLISYNQRGGNHKKSVCSVETKELIMDRWMDRLIN